MPLLAGPYLPGDIGGGPKASAPLCLVPGSCCDSLVERLPWHNFHTGPRHSDHFLAEAFRGTAHWGAYMTDLLTEVNSKSKTLDLRADTIRRDVAVLAEQRTHFRLRTRCSSLSEKRRAKPSPSTSGTWPAS
jgi:hypothetical protein